MKTKIKTIICFLCFTLTESMKEQLFLEKCTMDNLFQNWKGRENEKGISENQLNFEKQLPLRNHLGYSPWEIYDRENLIKNTAQSNLEKDVIAEEINSRRALPYVRELKQKFTNNKLNGRPHKSVRNKHQDGMQMKNEKMSINLKPNNEDSSLIGLMSLKTNNQKTSNYNVTYNKDRDPIILYNGPLEKNTYFNTGKRNIENENKDLTESLNVNYNNRLINPFFKKKLSNPKTKEFLQSYNDGNNLLFGNLDKNDNTVEGNYNWKLKDYNFKKPSISFKIFNKQKMNNSSSINTDEYRMAQPLYITTVDSITIRPLHKQEKINEGTKLIQVQENRNAQRSLIEGAAKNSINSQFVKSSRNCSNLKICHPRGGEAKFHKEKLLADPRDKQYNDVLRGILTIKVVQTIINKVTKIEKMKKEFGLCYKNISQVTPNILNKVCTTTCTPLYGELKCFLNWLMSADLTRIERSSYYNIKPDRNFLFDHDFLNPWPKKEKREAIALPPSLYGFAQQPIYRFGRDSYTSNIFDQPLFHDEDNMKNQLIYRSKIVLFPDGED